MTSIRRFKRLQVLWLAVAVCAIVPAAAIAQTPIVRLKAALTPDTLGASTTVGFGFSIRTASGAVPPPLVGIRVAFPFGLSFLRSTLGLGQRCSPTALLERGIISCPLNARMGAGHARMEAVLGDRRISEPANITVLAGEPNPNYVEGLFFTTGWSPLDAQLVFPMAMYFETGTRIRFDATLPLIPTWPDGPIVSVVDLGAEIGPRHLTYTKEVDGRTVSYHPAGLVLPKSCPRGGFRFSASFFFQDGSHVSKQQAVPCPVSRRPRPSDLRQ